MARASGLNNVDQVKVAAIERVNLDTPNDELNPQHYDTALTSHTDYPYVKTRAGALQGPYMPWDLRTKQVHWGMAGGISAAIALLSKIV